MIVMIAAIYIAFLYLNGTPAPAAASPGPTLVVNGGFEGGDQFYQVAAPFQIARDPENAHSGSWVLAANVQAGKPTNDGCWTSHVVSVWPHTAYVASVWIKGRGALSFCVAAEPNSAHLLARATASATSDWRHIWLPFDSADRDSVAIGFIDDIGTVTGTVYLDDLFAGLANGDAIRFDPAHPGASHPSFHLIFDDEFGSTATIDIGATGRFGFLWYPQQFYGLGTAPRSSYSVSNGKLVFSDSPDDFSEVLHTACPANSSSGFIGTVFRAGKGVYFEARIACSNIGSIGHLGWPAFWLNDVKGDTKLNMTMPGNPGHNETIEPDIFEYNPNWGDPADWVSAMHDWCDVNLGNTDEVIAAPVGTDYTKYHTYGLLWMPALEANGWHGYRETYFDGVPEQGVCWLGNQTYHGAFPETNASMGSYLFSLMDSDEFDLILGSARGGVPTMSVDYVRVYAVDNSSLVHVKR